MDESGIEYIEDVGGAAHYGPKVDFIIRSVTGKEFAASTNQVDLYMPDRFDLSFTNNQGKDERPVIIHRAPLGSHERFVAYLIEHYAGAFPVWLAPVQVQIIPITNDQVQYCSQVASELERNGVRVNVDDTDDRMQAKIRKASKSKVPYQLIVGEKEERASTVSVRLRGGEDIGTMQITEFAELIQTRVTNRSLQLME